MKNSSWMILNRESKTFERGIVDSISDLQAHTERLNQVFRLGEEQRKEKVAASEDAVPKVTAATEALEFLKDESVSVHYQMLLEQARRYVEVAEQIFGK